MNRGIDRFSKQRTGPVRKKSKRENPESGGKTSPGPLFRILTATPPSVRRREVKRGQQTSRYTHPLENVIFPKIGEPQGCQSQHICQFQFSKAKDKLKPQWNNWSLCFVHQQCVTNKWSILPQWETIRLSFYKFDSLIAIWYKLFQLEYGPQHRREMAFNEQNSSTKSFLVYS